MMKLVARPGLAPYYSFESLVAHGLRHAVFGRVGGVSISPWESLNVGHKVGDDPQAVAENHRIIYETLGLADNRVVTCQQIHGDRVVAVRAGDGGRTFDATDGLVCDVPDLALMMRFADCVPVLLYVPSRSAIGLAHAGWRGTVAKVVTKTAQAIIERYGCRPDDMLAAIGPSIGPCCYEVGEEVVALARDAFPDAGVLTERNGRHYFDLWLANAWQLRQLGVHAIEVAGVCTACHSDTFYSHRKSGHRKSGHQTKGPGGHGPKGSTGRFAVVIG